MNNENFQTDILLNGNKIIQNKQFFMYGIDAVLLSAFTLGINKKNLSINDTLIDLGTGNGIIPLLIQSQKKQICSKITGLEIQPELYSLAQQSIALNKIDNIEIITGDIKKIDDVFLKHSFNVVTSNPPYMKNNSCKKNNLEEKSIARHELLCSLEDVIKAADYLLKPHGKFFMIHRANRFSEISFLLKQYRLEPKIIQFVHPYEGKDASMVLIEARKNAVSDTKILSPLFVYDKFKRKTDNNRIYSSQILDIYNFFKQ